MATSASRRAGGTGVDGAARRATALGGQGWGVGGVDIGLTSTGDELQREFKKAPWLTNAEKSALVAQLNDLVAIPNRAGATIGKAAEALAASIAALFATYALPSFSAALLP